MKYYYYHTFNSNHAYQSPVVLNQEINYLEKVEYLSPFIFSLPISIASFFLLTLKTQLSYANTIESFYYTLRTLVYTSLRPPDLLVYN